MIQTVLKTLIVEQRQKYTYKICFSLFLESFTVLLIWIKLLVTTFKTLFSQ